MNPTNFVTQMELGLKEIGLGNFWEALAQFQFAEQLAGELSSFSSERLAYGYSRIERTDDAERLFDQAAFSGDFETPWSYPAIGDLQQVLDLIERTTEKQSSLRWTVYELRVNSWNDPILDQPEFVEVRSRLGFRE